MADFSVIVNPDTSDTAKECVSLSVFLTRNACNFTASTVRVFSHSGFTGTVQNGEPVTGATSGATGVCRMATANQILISGISGTFQNGEQVRKDVNNFVILSSTAAVVNTILADCRCTAGTEDVITSQLSWTGWTLGASNKCKIWTDPSSSYRHVGGKWTTGNKYRIRRTITGDDQSVLTVAKDYVSIIGLQIDVVASASYVSSHGIYDTAAWQHSNFLISHNIIRCSGTNANYANNMGIYSQYPGSGVKIFNNIIYGFKNAIAPNGYGIYIAEAGVVSGRIYANTIYDCGLGIYATGGTPGELKNNLIQGCRDNSISGSFESTSTGNVIDEDSAGLGEGAFGAPQVSGRSTSYAAPNKLIDSGYDFSSVLLPPIVQDNSSNFAKATALDSTHQFSVSADIFGSGEPYTIYRNLYGAATFKDATNKDFNLDPSDTGAVGKGVDIYSDAGTPNTDDLAGNPRPSGSNHDAGALQKSAVSVKVPIQIIMAMTSSTGSLTND